MAFRRWTSEPTIPSKNARHGQSNESDHCVLGLKVDLPGLIGVDGLLPPPADGTLHDAGTDSTGKSEGTNHVNLFSR
jgi:hypothetical protein